MTTTSNDWIREGANVAEYSGGYDPRVTLTTIERLTKTQIVLANGNRYNRDRQRPVGDPYGSELLPADNVRVQDVQARQALRSVAFQVEKLGRGFQGGQSGALAALAEIEQMIAAARAAITGKEA